MTRFFVLCPCVCSGPGPAQRGPAPERGMGKRQKKKTGWCAGHAAPRRGPAPCVEGRVPRRAWRASCTTCAIAVTCTGAHQPLHAWTALTSISVHTSRARPWCLAQGRRRRQQQQQQQRKQRKKERRRRQRGRGATHAAGSWRSTWTAAPRAPRAFTKGQTAARRRLPRTRRHTCCRRWSAWLMAP